LFSLVYSLCFVLLNKSLHLFDEKRTSIQPFVHSTKQKSIIVLDRSTCLIGSIVGIFETHYESLEDFEEDAKMRKGIK